MWSRRHCLQTTSWTLGQALREHRGKCRDTEQEAREQLHKSREMSGPRQPFSALDTPQNPLQKLETKAMTCALRGSARREVSGICTPVGHPR